MKNLRPSPISSCKNLPPYFFMVDLLHRLYGVDAPVDRYCNYSIHQCTCIFNCQRTNPISVNPTHLATLLLVNTTLRCHSNNAHVKPIAAVAVKLLRNTALTPNKHNVKIMLKNHVRTKNSHTVSISKLLSKNA